MDAAEYWLIYDPIDGYEEQINALYAEMLGEPDAIMVLSPERIKGSSLTMVDRWKYNRYPIYTVEANPQIRGRQLMARYLVLDQQRRWFKVREGLAEAKQMIDHLMDLQELGQLQPFNLATPKPQPFLIKPEFEASARAESFFF